MIAPDELRLPALEIAQAPGLAIYLFTVDGQLAPVAQIRRVGPGSLLCGYQTDLGAGRTAAAGG